MAHLESSRHYTMQHKLTTCQHLHEKQELHWLVVLVWRMCQLWRKWKPKWERMRKWKNIRISDSEYHENESKTRSNRNMAFGPSKGLMTWAAVSCEQGWLGKQGWNVACNDTYRGLVRRRLKTWRRRQLYFQPDQGMDIWAILKQSRSSNILLKFVEYSNA